MKYLRTTTYAGEVSTDAPYRRTREFNRACERALQDPTIKTIRAFQGQEHLWHIHKAESNLDGVQQIQQGRNAIYLPDGRMLAVKRGERTSWYLDGQRMARADLEQLLLPRPLFGEEGRHGQE